MTQLKNYNTKKKGKTEVYPFWNMADIKNVVEWFENHGDWDGYLITMLGLLIGRRIGDTIMMKWSDLYEANGRKKDTINTIEEQKTGKVTNLPVSNMVFEAVDNYIEHTNINPIEHLDDYIFEYETKRKWKNDVYQMENESEALTALFKDNNIDEICEFYHKDFSDKRKEKIIRDFEKQNDFGCLVEFYNYEVVYNDVVKWQTDDYRKKLKKAAKDCKISYHISTHTLRKSLGYWIHKNHQFDPDCLLSLQKLFNHSDLQTTMDYIGLTEERNRMYMEDHGDFIRNVLAGKGDEIVKNMPVISMKSDDFGNVIMTVIKQMQEGKEAVDVYQMAVNMANELRIG